MRSRTLGSPTFLMEDAVVCVGLPALSGVRFEANPRMSHCNYKFRRSCFPHIFRTTFRKLNWKVIGWVGIFLYAKFI